MTSSSNARRLPDGLPFTLPLRPAARRIRDGTSDGSIPRQPMAGFETRFTDIVDYIVRITDEIWRDHAIGYIHDTYDPAAVVYSSYGVVRSAERIVQSTITGIAGVPDGDTHHLNVALSGDEVAGFYSAHLGFGGGTNVAPTIYGPATGNRYVMRFAADCISRANLIHTEWLVRDSGAMVRQLGLVPDSAARAVAALPVAEPYVVAGPLMTIDFALLVAECTPRAWVADLVATVWNGRRFDRLARFYAPDVVAYSGGGRTVQGLPALSNLLIGILAAIPDGVMIVDHVCWSEEVDGVIVAVRWTLVELSGRGGVLGGELSAGRPVYMMGVSHLRLDGPLIVEEWTVFDEIAVMAMAYRA